MRFPLTLEHLKGWKPYIVSYDDGTSRQIGEITTIRQTVTQAGLAEVIVWRGGPGKYPAKPWGSSEIVGFVISGSVSVHRIDEGTVDLLKTGMFFRYDSGTVLQWEYHEPVMKVEFYPHDS